MHETAEDLRELGRVLDASYAAASAHLRSILRPERRMTPEQVVRALRGVFVLHLATVTASGAPRVAPVDGLFYRGRLWFGLPPGALRQRHVRARPRVSATWTVGEELVVIVHGTARAIEEGDPDHAGYVGYCREVYGAEAFAYWRDHYADRGGRELTARIDPERMFASASRPERIG